ncbi:MAG: L-aspartate oxidase [Bacteroidota bacterium]
MSPTHESDFLILGSGIAGLTFALKASLLGSVTIITKKERAESNTNYAQGGIAAVVEPTDTFEAHIADTLIAGAGLCNEAAVRTLVLEGPDRIRELIELGADFTRSAEGKLDLGREGGHGHNRIVHAADLTGREVERALLQGVADRGNITLLEHYSAIELITEHHIPGARRLGVRHRNCHGVYALNTGSGEIETFLARRTLLATGGCGQVYLHTTNPTIATGDGYAMAYRAGAVLANMEFVQFHPTSLYAPERHGTFLISEAVRGHGGILRNTSGERFMSRYDERLELAPRDIVARAIDAELKKSGDPCVYLDVTHIPIEEFREHFPNIEAECANLGIDVAKAWIPVVPAAHYQCGGVRSDLSGRTSINNLYVCGETSCTGVHGANRLASNSLLEALVFAHRAYLDIETGWSAASNTESFPQVAPWNDRGVFNVEEWIVIEHDRQEIQRIMWDLVGIVRSNVRLLRAQRRIRLIRDEIEEYFRRTKITLELLELRNMAETALLIVDAAITRKESRGLHYTTDYPDLDDTLWLRDTIIENPVP